MGSTHNDEEAERMTGSYRTMTQSSFRECPMAPGSFTSSEDALGGYTVHVSADVEAQGLELITHRTTYIITPVLIPLPTQQA